DPSRGVRWNGISSRGCPVNRGQFPSGTDDVQRAVGKPGRADNSGQVERVSLILFAVGAVTTPIERILVGVIRAGTVSVAASACVVTDAMGKRVVRVEVQVLRCAVLHGKKHPVVVLRTAVHDFRESPDFA